VKRRSSSLTVRRVGSRRSRSGKGGVAQSASDAGDTVGSHAVLVTQPRRSFAPFTGLIEDNWSIRDEKEMRKSDWAYLLSYTGVFIVSTVVLIYEFL
jgi:hypothetical protein